MLHTTSIHVIRTILLSPSTSWNSKNKQLECAFKYRSQSVRQTVCAQSVNLQVTTSSLQCFPGIRGSYCAFMRLLPCVTPHVDHQHVLRLEGLLLPRTLLPATHKLLLLTVDVVVVDVLRRQFSLSQSSQSINNTRL